MIEQFKPEQLRYFSLVFLGKLNTKRFGSVYGEVIVLCASIIYVEWEIERVISIDSI